MLSAAIFSVMDVIADPGGASSLAFALIVMDVMADPVGGLPGLDSP